MLEIGNSRLQSFSDVIEGTASNNPVTGAASPVPGKVKMKSEHFLTRDLSNELQLPCARGPGRPSSGDVLDLSPAAPLPHTGALPGELKVGTHHQKPFQVCWVLLYFNALLGGLNFEEVKLKEQYFCVDSGSILSLISPKPSLGS